MCLLGLTHADETPIEGFKILVETEEGLTSPVVGDQIYVIGKTYKDPHSFEIDCSVTNESYETGFHACNTLEAAKLKLKEYQMFNAVDEFVIVRIAVEDVVATGYETVPTGLFSSKQVEVFVAKKMTLDKIVYETKLRNKFKRWWLSKFSSKG